jgi:hypothetical protein
MGRGFWVRTNTDLTHPEKEVWEFHIGGYQVCEKCSKTGVGAR